MVSGRRGAPFLLWAQPARRRRARSVPCPLIYLAQGVTLLLLRYAMRWKGTLPYRGVPPFVLDRPVRRGRARYVPLPLLPARGLRALLGRGVPVLFLGPVCRGGPEVVCSGDPPCAPAARRWRALLGGGSPSPFFPSSAARVRRGRPFGGPLVAVCPLLGSRALRAHWEPPSGSRSPPHGGVSRWSSQGPPPASSLRAMDARCWVGVSHLPPPLVGRSR